MERDCGTRLCRGWSPSIEPPWRILSSETRPPSPPPPFALSWRVSPAGCGLWTHHRNTEHQLLRGKCCPATHFTRKRNTIRALAQQLHPRQRLVRQRVSGSGRTPEASGPSIGPYGSDPPGNGPRMCNQAIRGGRSLDLSLQEGRIGVVRMIANRHAPLTGCAIRFGFQCSVATGLDCGNVSSVSSS